jgi:hypothetical protein
MQRHYGNIFKIGALIQIGRKIKAVVDKRFGVHFIASCRHTFRHRIRFPAHGSRAETNLIGAITRSTNLVRSSLMQ